MRTRALVIGSALFLVAAVQRWTHSHPRNELDPSVPAVHLDARPVRGGHPRLLLDGAAIERLRAAAKKSTPAWRAVEAQCERDDGDAGYAGFDWAYALAERALCWHATGAAKHAKAALGTLNALLDDRQKRGDGAGGDTVVTHDDGYPIRTHGVYVALAYDWLHDAPGMTPALREKMIARLRAWLGWYAKKGYHRRDPGSNYYLGYFAAQLFAGLAVAGEAPDGDEWLRRGRDEMLAGEVIPFFGGRLRGGDFPEGWQYGELSAAELALAAEAMRTATGEAAAAAAARLPWLREVVTHHLHALLPGSAQVFDNGDWGEHPCKPSRIALTAIALALDGSDAAAQARWMVKNQLAAFPDVAWMSLVAERPGGAEKDPHPGAALSLHAPGTGLTLARSAWTPDAIFVGFQAGARLAEDHQHYDQGHFELWRGADALLVDGGDYGSYATLNHNTLLVDDGGAVLNYVPNQGAWGYRVRTLRFGDDGVEVVAVGDLTDAYLPGCSTDGCDKRALRSAIRTLVYLRPATVVVEDRLVLASPSYGASFAAHTIVAPQLDGDRLSARVGGSRLDLVTVEPAGAEHAIVKQPTQKGAGAAKQDDPWGPIWRVEIRSPRGQAARRFLHVATAGPAQASAPSVAPLRGEHLAGAQIGRRAVLFADDTSGGRCTLPRGTDGALVVNLSPGAGYRAELRGCALTVARGGSATASSGGALAIAVPGCP